MENMQYAEELFQEFLVFRGFTNTLQSYDSELRTDLGKGFYVDKIIDLIFSFYVPKFQVDRLVALVSLLCSPKSKLLFPAFTSFTPCKPIVGTESSTSSLSMTVTSCNAHRIGLAGWVYFSVDGDDDVGLGGEVVDLIREKKVEKEAGGRDGKVTERERVRILVVVGRRVPKKGVGGMVGRRG
ncbi:uncharacterized protein LOC130946186 [Arachis stenosperma]|uniref:uncharacterized protein LOC130946186 n=1 Tax=Arachis stenosperma TaxID=217475 RepID=UPI0025ABDCE6|nr:uncharacterized protein LOC130946186 [Arachis stenosperma]